MPQLGQGDDADHQRTHARSLHLHREDAPVPPIHQPSHRITIQQACVPAPRAVGWPDAVDNVRTKTHRLAAQIMARGGMAGRVPLSPTATNSPSINRPRVSTGRKASRFHPGGMNRSPRIPTDGPQGDAEAGYYDHTLKGRHGPRLPLTNTSGARSLFPFNLLPRLYQEPVVIARVNRKEFTAKLKPEEIDYKRLDVLARFLTPIGKIEPARRTGATRTQQARIVRAIKRARYLGLLPYTINDSR